MTEKQKMVPHVQLKVKIISHFMKTSKTLSFSKENQHQKCLYHDSCQKNKNQNLHKLTELKQEK